MQLSVPSAAGEHLPVPGHDRAEGPQDDSGGQAGGSHSAGGAHQSAQLHHGGQPNISDVRTPRTVRQAHSDLTLKYQVLLITLRE